jgi:hypothetical protein
MPLTVMSRGLNGNIPTPEADTGASTVCSNTQEERIPTFGKKDLLVVLVGASSSPLNLAHFE